MYSLFGWEQNDSIYELAETSKDITLTVKKSEEWEAYMDSLAGEAQVAATSDEDRADGAVAEPIVEIEVDPVMADVADTRVQTTWGTEGASLAFGDTLANRGAYSTTLAEGKGAAWISTMGGSSRISSDAGHAGADYTLTGAAFGNSWGKVSTFSAYPVDQDSTHMGIYGNHTLGTNTTLSWAATHTRTESDGTLAGMPANWTQDALQLDARLTRHKQLSHKTMASAFVGLQYLATDSGEYAGIRTGSLQNLRAEIGVGATHRVSPATLVYGELSFVGDMVRNNPTADLGGYRAHGANPGRAGINLGVGATHQLTEDWSVNASYNFELMQNVTTHSLNLGASYSF